MKILYVDHTLTGHHRIYFSTLYNAVIEKSTVIAYLPTYYKNECIKIYHHKFKDSKYNFLAYVSFISNLYKIIIKEKPDIVHFLYGDIFYRYFGFGIYNISRISKVIITFHHIRRGKARDISLKRIFRHITFGVVHTESLKSDLAWLGIRNVIHIEYPQFNRQPRMNSLVAKERLGIATKGVPLLLALGGTREDKGLDILLKALQVVRIPFHLLIAGTEETFSREFITQQIQSYQGNVTILLKYLAEEEFTCCLNASDYIVLPYRKIFDGASGPLGEGVALGKTIIGPAHGSLGDIIRSNHLGYTFCPEEADDLARTINRALAEPFKIDKKYLKYKESIKPAGFITAYKRLYMVTVQKLNYS